MSVCNGIKHNFTFFVVTPIQTVFSAIAHPQYSADLAPSDFHVTRVMLGPFKDPTNLCRIFKNDYLAGKRAGTSAVRATVTTC